ncbi:QueD-like queosine biosynthesis protein [Arthrobacter phage Sonali]|uniref:QueD-like queosine biosynthesis protein n=1 Tax=Arthrobacter phage Sonali TaxID=2510495 RepID=A0A411CQK3_9CAUD|nr:QueD-like 6-pyruvoyl-tetrahydropterin synthase [Arthrobacter phage Sonali]QAY16201.1 QueD-like queosine biosynthesis protein [Arthrobacter phage Sonali]
MTLAAISKDFQFSASHQLEGLPSDHPCSRLHGHNYTVKLVLEGEVDPIGFVVDYRRLGAFKDYLDEKFDHRHLNDFFPGNPTAERMADFLADKAVDLLGSLGVTNVYSLAVSVSETPKTWATVSRHLHIERNL